MNRVVLAFAVAPLSSPTVVACLAVVSAVSDSFRMIHNPMVNPQILIGATVTSAVFSYGSALLLGIPGYLWLRRRKITSFWVWPALGFGVGIASGFILASSAIMYSFGRTLPHPDLAFETLPTALFEWLLIAGIFGTLAGIIHRLIAPPAWIATVEEPKQLDQEPILPSTATP